MASREQGGSRRLEELLRAMKEHPGRYLGDRQRFTMMMGFIEGFQTAMVAGDGLTWDAFAPIGFSDHVFARTRPDWIDSAHGWENGIRSVTSSEEEALQLYFELRIEFLLKAQAANGSGVADEPNV